MNLCSHITLEVKFCNYLNKSVSETYGKVFPDAVIREYNGIELALRKEVY